MEKYPKAMKPKILIVDDEEGIRQLYTRFCWTLKYDTVLAASGTQALEMLDDHGLEFDAAVIDIHLGDMLGTELIGLLKTLRPGLAVAATSSPFADRVHACLRAGIDAFSKSHRTSTVLTPQ
jgi:CheY-like chemotaxis protein